MSLRWKQSEESLPLIERSSGPTTICWLCLFSTIAGALVALYLSIPSGLFGAMYDSASELGRSRPLSPQLARFKQLVDVKDADQVSDQTSGEWALRSNGGYSKELQFAIVAALADLANRV